MRRAAVLGSPVAHSLSPALHRAAYTALGLAGGWEYGRFECDEAALPGFLDSCGPEWAGLSLTMPLKKAALACADTADPVAVAVGAANTLVLSPSGRHAANTDVDGVERALAEGGAAPPQGAPAVVLGGGATAASAVAALHRSGAGRITVLARDPRRARGVVEAAERIGADAALAPLAELGRYLPVPLVASTLPASAADAVARQVADGAGAVFDVVYAPWPTALGAAAQAAGVPAVGGLPMLVHQAAVQVELMTGRAPAPVQAMRDAVSSAGRGLVE
ncbi:shikimate dehydrogenase [Nocardiopsis coralliicola]